MAGTIAVTGTVLAGVGSAAAAEPQHAHANIHVKWNWAGSGYWNVDQNVVVKSKARASYWAMHWNWTNASYGGYMGVQTDGTRGDGTSGDTAIFSLWNANGASGTSCLRFGGEGVGYSCRIAHSITPGRTYKYRLWRLDQDWLGQWWGAWIIDVATGAERFIGKIRSDRSHDYATSVENFSEYYGSAVACERVPRSEVDFTQPVGNYGGKGVYQYGAVYGSHTKGSCTDGSVTEVSFGWTKAARTVLGG